MSNQKPGPKPRSARRSTYSPEDLSAWDYERDAGDPGRFPYTRGIRAAGYRERTWTMRQYAGFGSAEDTNRRFRLLLERGSTGLSIAFDLPTQIGLDSDHALAEGEVGRVGVAVSCLEDMETLFQGIPLEQVSVSMTINATAPILMALYLAMARRRGVPWTRLRGTVQNDVLKEYLARGTFIYPPAPSVRLAVDLIEFCCGEVPLWNPISVSGYHLREAGCTAAQELALTLSHAEAYLAALGGTGISIPEAARRFSFFFAVHNDFLEEIAKFRAARRLWATRLRERCGIDRHPCQELRFHAQTAGSTLTAQQPDNNLVRVAFQAMAAVLGGAQSLHTNARDEALALPSEQSATLALRTQQILAAETGVTAVADPVGGSWCVESLTEELVAEAEACLLEIERRGGVLSSLDQGYQRALIDEAAYRSQLATEAGEITVVGLNRYEEGPSPQFELESVDPNLEKRRRTELIHRRTCRNPGPLRDALTRAREAVEGGLPLMPHFIHAVDAGATVGELSDILRNVYGEHHE